jgi:hypothetical protein
MSDASYDAMIDHIFTNVVTSNDCSECEYGQYWEDWSGTGDSPGAWECLATEDEQCPVVRDYIEKHSQDDYDDVE